MGATASRIGECSRGGGGVARALPGSWLETAAKLPETIADENWLASVVGDGEEPQEAPITPMAPGEAKRTAEKTKHRRVSKTEQMRRARAEGRS